MTRKPIALEAEDVQGGSTGFGSSSRSSRASRKRLRPGCRRRALQDRTRLHEGVQQHLIALAVNLQLAGRLADDDPTEVGPLLEVLARDVQQAAAEAALACRADLPAAPRSGRACGGPPHGRGEARAAPSPSRWQRTWATHPRVSRTVYLCCLEAFAGADPDAPPPKVHGSRRRGSAARLRGRRGQCAVASQTQQARTTGSTGCATASRRSAAGSPIRSGSGLGVRVSGSLPLVAVTLAALRQVGGSRP